jgi:hypothetical protein
MFAIFEECRRNYNRISFGCLQTLRADVVESAGPAPWGTGVAPGHIGRVHISSKLGQCIQKLRSGVPVVLDHEIAIGVVEYSTRRRFVFRLLDQQAIGRKLENMRIKRLGQSSGGFDFYGDDMVMLVHQIVGLAGQPISMGEEGLVTNLPLRRIRVNQRAGRQASAPSQVPRVP